MEHQKRPPFWKRIALTRLKLMAASLLFRVVHLFIRNNNRRILRGGIHYQIDLSEGIDFCLFLFGHFQQHVLHSGLIRVPIDAVVLDVGANIGAMTLQFAKLAPEGKVHAFEPTNYAFNKLICNIALNPELGRRINPLNMFVSDKSTTDPHLQAYPSWKIDGKKKACHSIHGGTLCETGGISAVSIDDFCRNNRIKKVDIIKIDTDGHELKVLHGARSTMESCKPLVVFEIGLYLIEEQGNRIEDYFDFFDALNYRLHNCKNNKIVTRNNYIKHIPLNATTDLIAIPNTSKGNR